MFNVKAENRISHMELRNILKLNRESLQNRRLQWFGHIEKMEESYWPNY